MTEDTVTRTKEVTSTELAEALDLPPEADVYALGASDQSWVFKYTVPEGTDDESA